MSIITSPPTLIDIGACRYLLIIITIIVYFCFGTKTSKQKKVSPWTLQSFSLEMGYLIWVGYLAHVKDLESCAS